MKLRLNPNGYFQVPLNKNGKRKMCSVHILVAKTFLKQRCKTDIVNHKDGNKQNNNLENLEWIRTLIYPLIIIYILPYFLFRKQ